MNHRLPHCSTHPGTARALALFAALCLLAGFGPRPLHAQAVSPPPKPDPESEALLKSIFQGVDKFFSVKEEWVQAVTQEILEGDIRQLSFSLKEKERDALNKNIMKAGVAGFRPKNNRPGKTATITIYQLADIKKAPIMMKGLTEILNANRKNIDKEPDLSILNFQGSQPKDETFPHLSYHTYALTQKSDASKKIEKFQVLRASAGDLFIDAIVMNGDISKEKLLASAKAVLKNWKLAQSAIAPKYKLEESKEIKPETTDGSSKNK